MRAVADHTVIVTRDERGLARLAEYRPLTEQDRQDYYAWRVECSDPESCEGWTECIEAHEVDGRSAADGPYEADEADPWDGWDQYEFHGVLHEWQGGYWTVPYPGCVVAGAVEDLPDGIDTTVDGTYPVEAEWDDEWCYLTVSDGER